MNEPLNRSVGGVGAILSKVEWTILNAPIPYRTYEYWIESVDWVEQYLDWMVVK